VARSQLLSMGGEESPAVHGWRGVSFCPPGDNPGEQTGEAALVGGMAVRSQVLSCRMRTSWWRGGAGCAFWTLGQLATTGAGSPSKDYISASVPQFFFSFFSYCNFCFYLVPIISMYKLLFVPYLRAKILFFYSNFIKILPLYFPINTSTCRDRRR
jgi:hypothetical protein